MRYWSFVTAIAALILSSLPPLFPAYGQKAASTYSRSKSIPEAATSNFDPALRCMDDLLARSNVGSNVPIYIRKLTKEDAVGATTRDMMMSAIARMSEHSRLFTVYVDPSDEELDPAVLSNSAVIVGGSITSFDKAVGSGGTAAGLNFGPVGFGVRNQKMDSVISMTLYLQNRKGAVIPLTTQSISMTLKSKSKGGDLSGNVGLLGGFLEMEFSRDEGPMQAVRAMIDLSLIQSVGAWASVPYQRCLAIRQSDPDAIQSAQKAFDKMKPPQRLAQIAQGLTARGLYSGPADGTMTQQLRQAIAEFQVQQNLPSLGLPTFEVYYRLFAGSYGTLAAPSVPTGPKNPLGLRIAPYGPNFIPRNGALWILNDERASFAVTSVEKAHVTCFYTDAKKRSTRIFPNSQRPSDILLPTETLILPGPGDIYTIVAEVLNVPEYITCAAGREPGGQWMPADLQADLRSPTPLPVADSAALEQRLRRLPSAPTVTRLSFQSVCQMPGGGYETDCTPRPTPPPAKTPATK
jgi:peptidoglycan hydrolase-like protein with peptidoglycan-binding domain